MDFDAAFAGVHRGFDRQIGGFDDRIGEQFNGDFLNLRGVGIGIDQEYAGGRDGADVGAEFMNLMSNRLPHRVERRLVVTDGGRGANVDAIDHGGIVAIEGGAKSVQKSEPPQSRKERKGIAKNNSFLNG